MLITGETGTGKELVARAIHATAAAAGAAFVAVNCAAIPRDLLESELFGHARGAFTGATGDRVGAFRERGSAARCSSTRSATWTSPCRPRSCACCRSASSRRSAAGRRRWTSASSRRRTATSSSAVREGAFREDLLYRLNVVPIHLPPLRERIADIVPLAEHFLAPGRRPARSAPRPRPSLLRHRLARQRARTEERHAPRRDPRARAGRRRRPTSPFSSRPPRARRRRHRLAGRGSADRRRPPRKVPDPARPRALPRQPRRGRAAAQHPPPASLHPDGAVRTRVRRADAGCPRNGRTSPSSPPITLTISTPPRLARGLKHVRTKFRRRTILMPTRAAFIDILLGRPGGRRQRPHGARRRQPAAGLSRRASAVHADAARRHRRLHLDRRRRR